MDHPEPVTDFSPLVLQTERMTLRRFSEEHLPTLTRMYADPDVRRWIPSGVRDAAQTREALERSQLMRLAEEGDALSLAAVDRASGALVGEFLLILRSTRHRGGELGYLVAPEFVGSGLATEGARAMLDFAFRELRWHRVVGRIYSDNAASGRVLEKVGMRQEAYLVRNELLRGEWTDEVDYAVLEDEWPPV